MSSNGRNLENGMDGASDDDNGPIAWGTSPRDITVPTSIPTQPSVKRTYAIRSRPYVSTNPRPRFVTQRLGESDEAFIARYNASDTNEFLPPHAYAAAAQFHARKKALARSKEETRVHGVFASLFNLADEEGLRLFNQAIKDWGAMYDSGKVKVGDDLTRFLKQATPVRPPFTVRWSDWLTYDETSQAPPCTYVFQPRPICDSCMGYH